MSGLGARLAAAGLLLAALPTSSRARAQAPPTKQACYDAYEQGQRLRKSGQLSRARQNLLVCARDPCPAVFQPECLQWLTELDRVQPTVVIEVRYKGAAVAEARVGMDGEPLVDRLDGREVPVDPGEHVFRAELSGERAVEKREVLVEGDKAHHVLIEIAPPRPAPAQVGASPAKPFPWAATLSTGIGVAAVGSFAYFGLSGLARRSTLDACGQHCLQSDIDYTRTHFLVADVSLGVSVVALGLATYLWVRWASAQSSENPPTAGFAPPFRVTW